MSQVTHSSSECTDNSAWLQIRNDSLNCLPIVQAIHVDVENGSFQLDANCIADEFRRDFGLSVLLSARPTSFTG